MTPVLLLLVLTSTSFLAGEVSPDGRHPFTADTRDYRWHAPVSLAG
jgi:hypothetical protein